jgi:hypothetical protein
MIKQEYIYIYIYLLVILKLIKKKKTEIIICKTQKFKFYKHEAQTICNNKYPINNKRIVCIKVINVSIIIIIF